jgi:hypothetical protein
VPKDSPDALIWREGHAAHYLCRHCVASEVRTTSDSIGSAYRHAMAHLWRSHAMRRAWIVEQRPEFEQHVQLSLGLAAQHHTSFR